METIIVSSIVPEVEQGFLDYSMSVITDRALCDVRDGLKPVHRRILYAADQLGLKHNKPFKKSARLVGDVLGKYHAHGDTSVYEAMVKMAQPFYLRYPLIDGHGNFGTVDGDPAASMRYTEARLSQIAEEMFRDIDEKTVDFKLNFSEDEYEPIVLPNAFPNTIVNGTFGIAVGMASSFPTHNMVDTIDSIIAFARNKDISVKEIFEILKGPDFPTGNVVINRDELLEGYSTGKGRVRIRARYHLEKEKKKDLIVFTEVPYGVKKEDLLTKIISLCKDKTITGIDDVWDESSFDIRLIVEVASDSTVEDVLARLFAKTNLETTIGINATYLVNGEPKVLSIKQMISHYYDFQIDILTRKTIFLLDKVVRRLHILEGLKIAVDNIDDIIAIVRGSNSPADALVSLMKRFPISEAQGKAILEIKLTKLTKLEKVSLEEDIAKRLKEKAEYERILSDNDYRDIKIIDTLDLMKKKYGDSRRTEIAQIEVTKLEKEKIALVSKYVIVDGSNQVKISTTPFSKAILKTALVSDFITEKDHITFLASDGKVYRPTLAEFGSGGKLKVDGAKVVYVLDPKATDQYFVILTKNGIIKKSLLSEYLSIKRTGTIGIKLSDGDEVIDAKTISEDDIVLATKNGKVIHFSSSLINPIGRTAAGVKAVELKEGDSAVSFAKVNDLDAELILITNLGHMKRTALKEFPLQKRGGVGILGQNVLNENEEISLIIPSSKTMLLFYDEDKVKLLLNTEIPLISRTGSGNLIVKSKEIKNIINVEEK